MQGLVMTQCPTCKNENHQKYLKVTTTHQPNLKSDKSIWTMTPKKLPCNDSKKILGFFQQTFNGLLWNHFCEQTRSWPKQIQTCHGKFIFCGTKQFPKILKIVNFNWVFGMTWLQGLKCGIQFDTMVWSLLPIKRQITLDYESDKVVKQGGMVAKFNKKISKKRQSWHCAWRKGSKPSFPS